jgi:hypothetical protein
MQHPPAELERAEFPVDVVVGQFEIGNVHGRSGSADDLL